MEERLENVEIIWPHEGTSCQGKQIFYDNLDAMNDSDLMVAILEGAQVDDGTAWEIGYFFSRGKRIIGIRTDFRRAGEFQASIVNLMVEFSCISIVNSCEDLVSQIKGLLD